jgi:LysM repeat protein
VKISQSKKEADVKKRIALVLALVTIVAMVAASVALADNGGVTVGNIVGFPSTPGGAICLDAADGSMLANCHGQDPARPYEPIKFDGLHPGVYIATSDAFHAFVYVYPGKDNWVDWAWMVPTTWHQPMSVPGAPAWHIWQPGNGVTPDGPPVTTVNVAQVVDVTGSGKVGQAVDVKSPGPSIVHVDQIVNVQPAKPACFTYVVKRGDCLSRIAVKYGDTVSGLVSRNHIANPDKIRDGQRITICGR